MCPGASRSRCARPRAKAAAALAGAQADAAKPDILPAKGGRQQPGAKVNRGQAYADAKKAKAAK
jgi:hypothetical protein